MSLQEPISDAPFESAPDAIEHPSMLRRLGHMCAAAAVAFEANIIVNDGSRIAAAGAVLAATHDPVLATGVFGGLTVAVETAGAVGSADLLSLEKPKKLTEKIGKGLEKLHLSKVAHNVLADTAIAMTLGTSFMTFAKQSVDPTRTASQNIRYGAKMAMGVSAAASAEAYVISEGVANPGPITIAGGIIGLAAAIKGGEVLKHRISKKSEKGVQAYRALTDTETHGPQHEGLAASEIRNALADPHTKTLRTKSYGTLPLLTPLQHNPEYNSGYFSKHYAEVPVYYYSGNFGDLLVTDTKAAAQSIKHLEDLAAQGALVVTDYETKDSARLAMLEQSMDRAGIAYKKTEFTDPRNETYASVTHFAGQSHTKGIESGTSPSQTFNEAFAVQQAKNPELYNRQNGTALISAEEIDDDLMEEVWSMYQAQFEKLIAENPSMQAQTKADLRTTLSSDGAMLIATFEDGKPTCAGYFVSDITQVYWLRNEFYAQAFPGKTVWYFPGIAAKPEHEGRANSIAITSLGARIAHQCSIEPVITFQCTNISKDYIPRIVQLAVERTKLFTIDLKPIAEYKYVGYELSPDGVTE